VCCFGIAGLIVGDILVDVDLQTIVDGIALLADGVLFEHLAEF
jgi:hypothetical protein